MRHRSLSALDAIFRRAIDTGHRYTRFVSPNAFGWDVEDPRRPDPARLARLLELCRERGFSSVYLGTFPSEVRPESVTPEVLAVVRDLCDNDTICIGLQSGSDRMLEAIHRGHTVREGVDAILRIQSAGFVPRVDLLFGLPGETPQDQAETRQVIRRLVDEADAHLHVHVFSPLPGTPLAEAPPGRVDPETLALLAGLGDRVTGLSPRAEHDPLP